MRRVAILILVLTLASFAFAVGTSTAAATSAAAPGTPTPDEINAVAKELWCPLCNGVRLDNCNLQACVQMREVIGQQLAAGKSTDEIKAYFVQQYGDRVLGMPSGTGFNLVAWGLPILAGLVALGWLAYLVRLWMKRRPAPRQPGAAAGPSVNGSGDAYLRRVDEELSKYE